jgi:hypothetical protein
LTIATLFWVIGIQGLEDMATLNGALVYDLDISKQMRKAIIEASVLEPSLTYIGKDTPALNYGIVLSSASGSPLDVGS